jgi:LuxR family transcriptional regulator, maltose regulon positive regulatory protein
VTEVSAPPGSGKTLLLRSWIAESGLAGNVAWVPVQDGERDPQRFWISVAEALRGTAVGSRPAGGWTAAPDLDSWAVVERLLADLASLDDWTWLVIDDLHELRSAEALRQLELLLMRSPPMLRFVLATRHDLHLGLHRLRLEGELTEIRAGDLRFTPDEARALFDTAGVRLSDSALALLHARTEGWAAGLRLAALSLSGHPDPERFAAEFSGSERTVAEYLLAEVLERQSEGVRRLLLRTSVAERVDGGLADLLTGSSGGERVLHELEEANAFVVALDAQRSWFRYHTLFADLLQLELRRTEPAELPVLHEAAAGWFAEHGYMVQAIRHAQEAQNWGLAARLLADHWLALVLDGQAASAHRLLAAFPAGAVAADAELIALRAADELTMAHGSLDDAERRLAIATQESASVPAERREHMQVWLAALRLLLARQRGDLPPAAEEAQRLLVPALTADAAHPGRGQDLRALALLSLGIAELWAGRTDAEPRLEQGVALARRIGRPYLEIDALAHWAMAASMQSVAVAVERSMQAVELAREHGWSEEPVVALAYVVLGATAVWQGRLDEAEPWLARAGRALAAEIEPATGLLLHDARGFLQLARSRGKEALAEFRAACRQADQLAAPTDSLTRAFLLQNLVRLGETRSAEQDLAALDEHERETAGTRIALAVLRLAQDDPQSALTALAPVLDGSASLRNPVWVVQAYLLEATASDALGDAVTAGKALERALDLAEPDRLLLPFLLHPAPALLDRHLRQRSTHAALVSQILNLLAGKKRTSPPDGAQPLIEPLSQGEARVLRYLPTGLSAPEIADQLCVSVNTVKTHKRHVYAKLGTHRRHDAVERARTLGLLAPPTRRPDALARDDAGRLNLTTMQARPEHHCQGPRERSGEFKSSARKGHEDGA